MKTWQEKRAWLEHSAGLMFNVGTIIEDREVCDGEPDIARLWHYLYDNMDELYSMHAKLIDRIEDHLELKYVEDPTPPFGSSPTGFTRV